MSRQIGQFETLRGIAATWVFITHSMVIAEVAFWPLSDGGIPVDIFVVLSGFVITLLIINRPEFYLGYLFRRFMRLYPLFIVALGLGWATQSLAAGALAPILFGGWASPQWYAVVRGTAIVPNLLLHLTMFHGIVPDTILANAATAFSGPLWSISLEWQFYIVAPLFVALLKPHHHRPIVALLTVISIITLKHFVGRVWHASEPSFLPLRMLVFAVGVGSAHLWTRAQASSLATLVAVWAIALVMLRLVHEDVIALAIWATVYTIAATHRRQRWSGSANALLLLRPLRWIGERSYGIYVLHLPVLYIASTRIVPAAALLGQCGTLVALLAVYPAVVALSALLYRFLEQPIIRWAKRVEIGATARE